MTLNLFKLAKTFGSTSVRWGAFSIELFSWWRRWRLSGWLEFDRSGPSGRVTNWLFGCTQAFQAALGADLQVAQRLLIAIQGALLEGSHAHVC